MKTRTLGQGLEVSALGLGCMDMSQSFPPIPDRNDSIALIREGMDKAHHSKWRNIPISEEASHRGPKRVERRRM